MSALQPTNNPELIVNDFIQYAQSHLATVSGIVNTVSLYPPLGTPSPGVVQWTGYTVDGPQQSLNSDEEDATEETGDDAPPVDGRDAKEHDERNNVITEADETITGLCADLNNGGDNIVLLFIDGEIIDKIGWNFFALAFGVF